MTRPLTASVAFLLGIAAVVIADEPAKYRSIEGLPAAKREQFRREYEALKAARARLQQVEARVETNSPLLARVKDLAVDQSGRQGDLGLGEVAAAGRAYEERGLQAEYQQWLGSKIRIARPRVASEFRTDRTLRPLVNEAARAQFDAISSGKGRPGDRELLDRLLPKGLGGAKDLTPDQAGGIFVRWLKKNAELAKQDRKQAESKLHPTEEEEAWSEEWARLQASSGFYQQYIMRHQPAEVGAATMEVRRAYDRLSGIWPGWNEVLHEGVYEPLSVDGGSRGDASSRPSLWAYLILNLLLIGAFVAFRSYRSRSARAHGPGHAT